MFKSRNIRFDVHNGRVSYNTHRLFDVGLEYVMLKIPSYVVEEIYKHKLSLDIYYNSNYITTYSYDNLVNYIKGQDYKRFNGIFRRKQITYKLNRLEIRKYFTHSKRISREGSRIHEARLQKVRTRAVC